MIERYQGQLIQHIKRQVTDQIQCARIVVTHYNPVEFNSIMGLSVYNSDLDVLGARSEIYDFSQLISPRDAWWHRIRCSVELERYIDWVHRCSVSGRGRLGGQ